MRKAESDGKGEKDSDSPAVRVWLVPGYGKTKEKMEQLIINTPPFIIICDGGIPVGVISCKKIGQAIYEVGCLCIIPEFQGKITSYWREIH